MIPLTEHAVYPLVTLLLLDASIHPLFAAMPCNRCAVLQLLPEEYHAACCVRRMAAPIQEADATGICEHLLPSVYAAQQAQAVDIPRTCARLIHSPDSPASNGQEM